MALNLTGDLARRIAETRSDEMSSGAIAAIQRSVVDSLAVLVAGLSSEESQVLRSWAAASPGLGEATMVGIPTKVNADLAVLGNAVALHAFDFDDAGAMTQGHPGASVVPAALAAAEETGSSGRSFLEACLCGVESISRRISCKSAADSRIRSSKENMRFRTLAPNSACCSSMCSSSDLLTSRSRLFSTSAR